MTAAVPAPHNLYANMSDLWSQAGDSGEAVPIFEYGTPDGTPVTFAEMMVGGYSCDGIGTPRSVCGCARSAAPTHELTDGQASTNNVVVLVVPYGTSPFGGPESQTVGGGRAVVYSERQEDRRHLEPRNRCGSVDVGNGRRSADPPRSRAHLGRARRQRQPTRRRLRDGGSGRNWSVWALTCACILGT